MIYYQAQPVVSHWPVLHAVVEPMKGPVAMFKKFGLVAALVAAAPALAQLAPGVRLPPEVGAAYGRLGRAMMAHDADGVRKVWAEDFIVNSPNNTVLRREDVIAVMERDFLDYKAFHKHIIFVGKKPEVTVIMGYDTMIPIKGPGAGKQVTRPFTDIGQSAVTGGG